MTTSLIKNSQFVTIMTNKICGLVDGSIGSPSLYFMDNPTVGIYKTGVSSFNFVMNGNVVLSTTSTGTSFVLNPTNGIQFENNVSMTNYLGNFCLSVGGNIVADLDARILGSLTIPYNISFTASALTIESDATTNYGLLSINTTLTPNKNKNILLNNNGTYCYIFYNCSSNSYIYDMKYNSLGFKANKNILFGNTLGCAGVITTTNGLQWNYPISGLTKTTASITTTTYLSGLKDETLSFLLTSNTVVNLPKIGSLDIDVLTTGNLPNAITWNFTYFCDSLSLYFCFGNSDRYAVSSDGITWQIYILPMNLNYTSISFRNSVLYLIASGVNYYYTSTTGYYWTKSFYSINTLLNWSSIYSNDIFIMFIANNSSTYLYYNTTGALGTLISSTLPTSTNNKIIYANGIYLIITNGTYVSRSTDGINWVSYNVLANKDWKEITYGNGTFIVVGYATNLAYYSNDGISWSSSALGYSGSWSTISYGNGIFLASTNDGTGNFSYSVNNGVSWTNSIPFAVRSYVSSYFNGNDFLFISNSYSDQNSIYIRSNICQIGRRYTFTIENNNSGANFVTLTPFTGQYIGNSTANYRLSTLQFNYINESYTIESCYDGSSVYYWKIINRISPYDYTKNYLINSGFDFWQRGTSIIYPDVYSADRWKFETDNYTDEYIWVAVGDNSGITTIGTRSIDNGATWADITLSESLRYNSVAYGNGVWIAVGGNGAITTATRSLDNGATWADITLSESLSYLSVAYGNGAWIAVGNNGNTTIGTRSIDNGANWADITLSESLRYNSVAYGNGVWIAVGDNSSSSTTIGTRSIDNGSNWADITLSESLVYNSVAYGNGVWIAVGEGPTNTATRSLDNGATWADITLSESLAYKSVAYGNGVWIAVGDNGNTTVGSRSTDNGATWADITLSESLRYKSVCYCGNNVWIAVGDNLGSSTTIGTRSIDNGATWADITLSESLLYRAIASQFVLRDKIIRATNTNTNSANPYMLRNEITILDSTNPSYSYLTYNMENIHYRFLLSKLVTLSGWYKTDDTTTNATVSVLSNLTTYVNNLSLPATNNVWTYFRQSFILSDASITYLKIKFRISRYNIAVGVGINFSDIVLNEGNIACQWSPFNGNYIEEYQICQRYYEKSYNLETSLGTVTYDSTLIGFTFPDNNDFFSLGLLYTAEKYTTPTVHTYSCGGFIDKVSQGVVSGEVDRKVVAVEISSAAASTLSVSSAYTTKDIIKYHISLDSEI